MQSTETDDKATPADADQRDLVRELRHHHMRTGFPPLLEAADALAAERDRAEQIATAYRAEFRWRHAETDRADRAEADSKRIQMVRDALTQYEDGKYGPLAYLVQEIDRVVNNTKAEELGEATA